MSYRLLQVWTLCSIILTLLNFDLDQYCHVPFLSSVNLKRCSLIDLILISRLYAFLSCSVLEDNDDALSALFSLVLIALLCITDFFSVQLTFHPLCGSAPYSVAQTRHLPLLFSKSMSHIHEESSIPHGY